MNKIWIIVILVVVLIGGIIFFNKQQTNAPTISQSSEVSSTFTPEPSVTSVFSGSPTPSSTSAVTPKTYTITYKNGAIDKKILTIKKGDAVVFKNSDSSAHWPASDPHPIHDICPGFDALKPINNGGSYSRIFSEVKTCPFHDHLNPTNSALKGQIIVTQ